jgi:hypothetical protein
LVTFKGDQSMMRRNGLCALAVSLVLGAALMAAKPPSELPLLVTFGNGPFDALRSDGFTAPGYQADYANGIENVLAILQPSGNFRFFTQNDTKLAAQRSVCFDFGAQPVPIQPARCVNMGQPMLAYPTGDVPIQNLRYGQFVAKLTRFTWDEGSLYRYRLGYGTDMDLNSIIDSPPVTVTCIAPRDTSKPCTTWFLAPSTPGTAALFRFALSTDRRGNVIEGPAEFIGSYTMPFVETLTLKE